MKTRPGRQCTARLIMCVVWACFACSISVAANTWEDRLGRFALDLPDGYELKTESANALYTFGDTNPVGNICLTYGSVYSSLDEAFDPLVEGLMGYGFGAPPPETILEHKLDDRSARWSEFRSTASFDGRQVEFVVFVGAVVSPDEGGAGFVTFSLADGDQDHGEAAWQVLESIRLQEPSYRGIARSGT